MIEWNPGMAETMRQMSEGYRDTDDGTGSLLAIAVAAYREIERLQPRCTCDYCLNYRIAKAIEDNLGGKR
jgi:hypothetical protein